MVLRANTGGKSLDRGSVFGAISQCRGLGSAPEPEIGSLRAGGGQIGGELPRSGEAMECSDQPRQREPQALRASWCGEAEGLDMGAMTRGQVGRRKAQCASGSSCMLFVERACKSMSVALLRAMHR